jgi:hypothetical protein
MKLFLLSGGTVDVDRAVIFPGDDSHRRVTLPVVQILLQGEGRSILIDTGMPAMVAGDSEALKREYDIEPAKNASPEIDWVAAGRLGILVAAPAMCRHDPVNLGSALEFHSVVWRHTCPLPGWRLGGRLLP